MDSQTGVSTGPTKKVKCVFDFDNRGSVSELKQSGVYVIVEEFVDDSDDENSDDDDTSRVKRPRTIKTWVLCELPSMNPSNVLCLDVGEDSLAFVCANKWVVVVDDETWKLFLVDLVAGEYSCLPELNPEKYMFSHVRNKRVLGHLGNSLGPSDESYYWSYNCTCHMMRYYRGASVRDFITKFVMNVDDDGAPSIIVAMFNPCCLCFHCDLTWGDKVLAYCKLDDKGQHDNCWTPILAFPPHWIDGVFHKSNFLLLTQQLPFVLQTFSFKGIDRGGQPVLTAKVELESTTLWPLESNYYIKQLASTDDNLYMVFIYADATYKFGFHRNVKAPTVDFDPITVVRLSDSDGVGSLETSTKLDGQDSVVFPNLGGKSSDGVVDIPSTDLGAKDPVGVVNLEPTTNLGGKALFVGDISAFSIEGQDAGFVKPNTVYFTPREDLYGAEVPRETMPPLGLFDLERKEMQVLKWDHDRFINKIPLFV